MTGAHEASGAPDKIALFTEDPVLHRRRLVSGALGVALFAAAFGGVAGLIGGRTTGLVVACVVGIPLAYVVSYNVRRRVWLCGNELLVRTWGTRRLDITKAKRIDVLVTDVRNTRTVALLLNAGNRGGGAVKIDLAAYTPTAGRELGIVALRKLANALMNNIEANGMVFSELLVAQLRAEAKGDPLEARPLNRLATAAPKGKLAQRYTLEAVSTFVASLE